MNTCQFYAKKNNGRHSSHKEFPFVVFGVEYPPGGHSPAVMVRSLGYFHDGNIARRTARSLNNSGAKPRRHPSQPT